MTTGHPNAARVHALFDAFRSGDLAVLTTVLAEEAVWHFPGRRGRLAGDHVGRAAILGFLLQVPALTGGTFALELLDVLANDDRAVALFRGRATREGKTLDNPTCLVMRLDGDLVVELWEFVWDLAHVEDFWA